MSWLARTAQVVSEVPGRTCAAGGLTDTIGLLPPRAGVRSALYYKEFPEELKAGAQKVLASPIEPEYAPSDGSEEPRTIDLDVSKVTKRNCTGRPDAHDVVPHSSQDTCRLSARWCICETPTCMLRVWQE